jgi:uncharacterized protein involved in type VI secretion and phage assembly
MSTAAAQHVSGFKVSVAGSPLDDAVLSQVVEIKVRQSLHRPSSAAVKVTDPDRLLVGRFNVGDPLEISLGSADQNSPTKIFKGEIVALEPEFEPSGIVMGVRAYDRSHRLQRSKKVRMFAQMSASDIVTKVMSEAGISGSTDPTNPVFEFFQQSDETDRELIRRLERMHDMEFVIDDDEHYSFRKSSKPGSAAATLRYGTDLLTFRPRVSAVQQDKSVEVRGWDIKGKQTIAVTESSADDPAKLSGLQRSSVLGKFGDDKLLVSDRSVATTQEASALAKATIQRRAAAFIEAEGTCLGNPAVKAGATVQIDNVTSKYSGQYVVTTVTHIQRSQDAFKSHFTISGRSDRNLLDLVHPPQERPWGQTMVVGVVTNNNDADKMGRVKVKYPSLSDQDESDWARVLTHNAGADRGIYMLPQVGDEVVVAFENGDARRPLVVGSLFNGQDKPGSDLLPDEKGGFSVVSKDRGFIHTKEDLTFKSDKGMVIEVTNDQEHKVKGNIKSKADSQVEMKAGTTYTLEAGSSMSIKGVSITVEASASLTLKGATVDIQGTGPVNIKGAIINIG